LKVEIYFEFSPILERIWRDFEVNCDHSVFQCYDWLSHWQFTVGHNRLVVNPIVLVVTDQQIPVALFPFGLRRTMGIKVLEFLGGAQSDYNGPMVHPAFSSADQLRTIWRETEKKLPPHDVRSFVRLPAELNHRENLWPLVIGARFASLAFFASLPQTIAEWEQRISASRRADSKRQLRKLSDKGLLRFSFVDSNDMHHATVAAMIAQKRERYRETGVRDALSTKETQDFYKNLSGKLGEAGRIHVSHVSVDGKILAAHWGAIYGDRYYWLMPAYAGGEWKKFSVGRLLLEHNIRWAIENNMKIFDFTIGGEEYKKHWCDNQMRIYDRLDYFSTAGIFYVYVQRFFKWLRSNYHTKIIITLLIANCRRLFKIET
jgi:CelD/BcsL family acetyltransferase involved in cellulose biosynthesis